MYIPGTRDNCLAVCGDRTGTEVFRIVSLDYDMNLIINVVFLAAAGQTDK